MKLSLVVLIAVAALVGCGGDPNKMATYGQGGLPKNCRAYIQHAIDAYRAKQYTADETLAGIERNCGANGISWGQ